MPEHRRISEILRDLKDADRQRRSIYRAAGDDFGCDGSRERAEAAEGWVETYRTELAEARAARTRRKS